MSIATTSRRSLFLAALLALPLGIGVIDPGLGGAGIRSAAAEDEDGRPERETRKTPALRESAFKRLSAAQEAVDANDYQTALEELRELEETRGLNAYERASMQNMRAYIQFTRENYREAIRAYEGVLAERPEIPLALELSTLYALGQLYFVQEDYQRAIDYLNQWFQVAENPGPQPFIFLAQAHYQLNQFDEVPGAVDTAMDIARERDQEVKENWWLLKRAAYYEQEDWDQVIDILEILVRDFPKKEYWVQLSGLYGQEGDFKKQLAAIWTAYIQGYLDEEREIMNLTGLLMQDDVPFWSGRILEQAIDDGIVEDSAKNLQQLGQAWQLAQEVDRAIPVYQEAARKSDEGALYYRLAQLYLDKDQCSEAIDAADNALNKGGLDKEGQVYLVKGMCQFELEQYNAALQTFGRGLRAARNEGAETDVRSLTQWRKYVENERNREEELARAAQG